MSSALCQTFFKFFKPFSAFEMYYGNKVTIGAQEDVWKEWMAQG